METIEVVREIARICETSGTRAEARERVKAFHPEEDLSKFLENIRPYMDIKE